MERKHTFVYGIKGKLISAVAMLLVAVIMVVSSTYAWFTLSTAPEVTGITTNIGANGALEMALYNGTSPLEGKVNDTDYDINTYWGNLVNLTTGYGLDQITLYPGELVTTGGKVGSGHNGEKLDANSLIIKTPDYGTDGRLQDLIPKAALGFYQDGSFYNNIATGTDPFGVRGVGVSSGLSARQLAYRTARSNASTAIAKAKNDAGLSLNHNGNTLANIVIKRAMNDNPTYSYSDIEGLLGVITECKAVLVTIENAYMNYVYLWAASADNNSETLYEAVRAAAEAEGATLATVMDAAGTAFTGSQTGSQLATAMTALNQTRTNLDLAKNAIEGLEDKGDSILWSDIVGALAYIANPEKMVVNGYAYDQIKANITEIGTSGAVVVTVPHGSGVYADIADHCGTYTATVEIEEITYSGVTLNNLKGTMEATGNETSYSKLIETAATQAGAAAGSNTDAAISEFYGYIIDLAFRTNAAQSNLLLQTAPTDRIYSENDANETSATRGHGSTMTFTVATETYSIYQMAELMTAIRIVFFNTDNSEILATAKLDMRGISKALDGTVTFAADAKFDANLDTKTITANLYLYEKQTFVDHESTRYYKNGDSWYTKDDSGNKAYLDPEDDATLITTLGALSTTTEEFLMADQSAIMALQQNVEHHVSTLVYFDGNYVKNSTVAADGTKSMTGKLNLQFSSDANLVPMEYADVKNPNTDVQDPDETPTPTIQDKTIEATGILELTEGKTYVLSTSVDSVVDPGPAWTTSDNTITTDAATTGTVVYALEMDGSNPTGTVYKITVE